jgi:hypothetical protein
MMQVYIFVSEIDPSVRAFTPDGTGCNLPVEYEPWRAVDGGKSEVLGLYPIQ